MGLVEKCIADAGKGLDIAADKKRLSIKETRALYNTVAVSVREMVGPQTDKLPLSFRQVDADIQGLSFGGSAVPEMINIQDVLGAYIAGGASPAAPDEAVAMVSPPAPAPTLLPSNGTYEMHSKGRGVKATRLVLEGCPWLVGARVAVMWPREGKHFRGEVTAHWLQSADAAAAERCRVDGPHGSLRSAGLKIRVKYKDGDVWDHDLQIDASNITFTMRPA